MFGTKGDIKLFVRGEMVPKQDYVSVEIPPPSTHFTTDGEVIVKYSEENMNVKD